LIDLLVDELVRREVARGAEMKTPGQATTPAGGTITSTTETINHGHTARNSLVAPTPRPAAAAI